MNSTDEREHAEEAARIGRIYGGYARSKRRRRAWAADNPGNMAIRDELFDHLRIAAHGPLTGEGRVLDAGCGRGHWLGRLLAQGIAASRLHGTDLLSERVEAARVSPGVDIRVADVRDLPYPDGHFSLVLLFTVLSSLPSQADVRLGLAEARRVTEAGGLIVVYEPRVPQPLNRATLWIRRRDVREALGLDVETRTLTALPPLVRRLGRSATTLYPYLASCPPLRTHRLLTYRVTR